MSKLKITLGMSAFTLLLSGCGTVGSISPVYGNSVNNAHDKQIVSKAAVAGAPQMPGQMIDAAVERYHEDKVKKPVQSRGASGSGGSSSGGGSGGSN